MVPVMVMFSMSDGDRLASRWSWCRYRMRGSAGSGRTSALAARRYGESLCVVLVHNPQILDSHDACFLCSKRYALSVSARAADREPNSLIGQRLLVATTVSAGSVGPVSSEPGMLPAGLFASIVYWLRPIYLMASGMPGCAGCAKRLISSCDITRYDAPSPAFGAVRRSLQRHLA